MNPNFPNPRTYSDIFPDANVADWDIIDGAVGPGRRLCIWLQGCLWRCPGCRNGDFLPLRRRHLLSTADLLDVVGQPEQELTFRAGQVAATGTLPNEVFAKLREGLLQLGIQIRR